MNTTATYRSIIKLIIIIIRTLIIQLPIYQRRGQSLVLYSSASDPLRHHLHRQPYNLPSHEMMLIMNIDYDNDEDDV